ncbi:hypothetical protein JK635_07350 [Neobacillus sp. YIM B02564]|uniref:Phage tail protein n=1 Tax=Neobacillus paridis TaxID=2803862 RepID=A0ABS1TLY4_9BACI|nr:hypothetical protein [Neobacillus paridis]MBL4952024.1 hypothetical protein [Neobacillus paridis]
MYTITIEENGRTVEKVECSSLLLATNQQLKEDVKAGGVSVLGVKQLKELAVLSLLCQMSADNIMQKEILKDFREDSKGFSPEEVKQLLPLIMQSLYKDAFQSIQGLVDLSNLNKNLLT